MAQMLGVIALVFMPLVLLSTTEFGSAQNLDLRMPSKIKVLITDSPWAKLVMLRVKGDDWADGDNRLEAGKAPAGPEGAMQKREGIADADSEPRLQSVVRWDSALPVREACDKAGFEPYAFSCYSKIMFVSGQAQKFEALAKEFYILTVSNYPKTALARRDRDLPQHSSEANAALERLGERLKTKTFLKRKGKESIAPEKVLVLPTGQTLLVVVFFSRSAAITVEDRNVAFDLIDDPVEIRSRFNLNKMMFNGRLEL